MITIGAFTNSGRNRWFPILVSPVHAISGSFNVWVISVPASFIVRSCSWGTSLFYDIKLADLLSKRRHKSITVPRQVGMWLSRKHTRFSLEEIGGYFGGRDHTTVMHAIKSIDQKRNNDSLFLRETSRLEDQLSDKLHR